MTKSRGLKRPNGSVLALCQTTSYRPTPTSPISATPQSTSSATVEDIDALLDDIDACLEENALEVLRRFVQRGGQ